MPGKLINVRMLNWNKCRHCKRDQQQRNTEKEIKRVRGREIQREKSTAARKSMWFYAISLNTRVNWSIHSFTHQFITTWRAEDFRTHTYMEEKKRIIIIIINPAIFASSISLPLVLYICDGIALYSLPLYNVLHEMRLYKITHIAEIL